MMSLRTSIIAPTLLLLIVSCDGSRSVSVPRAVDAGDSVQRSEPDTVPRGDVFTLVRVMYDSTGGYGESWYRYEGRDWQRWETDYPRAELNLLQRLTELTSLKVAPQPVALRLDDPELFDYPFAFMSDVGWQDLSGAERAALTSWLEAGGFLWIDDFWGDAEWDNMLRNMGDLRPDWEWKQIPADHPLMTMVYFMKECPQVPARIFFAQSGLQWDPPGVHRAPSGGLAGVRDVHFMGLYDSFGRIVAVATHNTDIADGWEREGESEEFFERFSVFSYAITINIIFYALSH
jgi:hypothetical protein